MLRVNQYLATIAILMSLIFPSIAQGACTPTAAQICVGSDDESYVWINNNILNGGAVFDTNSCTSQTCVNVPASYINVTGTNEIAVENINVTAGYVWSSWVLQITCSSGLDEYISSSDGNVSYYNQVSSTAAPPANDSNSLTWYDPNYSNTTGWGVPVAVTNKASIYCVPATDPRTGTFLVPLGYSCGSGDEPGSSDEAPAGEILYFRENFTLSQLTPMTPNPQSPTPTITPSNTPNSSQTPTNTPTFTPTPTPVMNVTKTVNKPIVTLGDTVTFTLTYHNTGAVTAPNVPLWDTIPNCISYVGSSPAATQNGSLLVWNLGNINAGGSGSVTWWGVISCYPLNPFFIRKYYFACLDKKFFIADCRLDLLIMDQ